jgi:hypothetical protein
MSVSRYFVLSVVIVMLGSMYLTTPAWGAEPAVILGPGPHLFVDDYLIGSSQGLSRTTHQPVKLSEPIITGSAPHGDTPSCVLNVVHDREAGLWRMWYGVRFPNIHGPFAQYAYAESKDGVTWDKPNLGFVGDTNLIKTMRGFGLILIDDGPTAAGPRRYKFGHFGYAGSDGTHGMWVEFSANGKAFTPYDKNPVIRYTEQPGDISLSDIIDGCWDPLRQRYLVCFKTIGYPTDGYRGKTANINEGHRRIVGQSTSKDFINWTKPRRIVMPDPNEPGVEEFLSMRPIVRGNLYLGFLRILRDDMGADPGGPINGIGWTELCTSRDGENWERRREPFLDRGAAGTWDHAMAYMGDCITIGEQDYFYYGGSSFGHKSDKGRRSENALGLAKLRRNGFVSRDAGATRATLRTPLVTLDATDITINANVKGSLRLRIVNQQGEPIPGFDFTDGPSIQGDATRHPVKFKHDLAALIGQRVYLEFSLQGAELYGFDLTRR